MKRTFLKFPALVIGLTMAIMATMFAITAPAMADSADPYCQQSTTGVTGDDYVSMDAGSFMMLDGTGTPFCDILANDDPNGQGVHPWVQYVDTMYSLYDQAPSNDVVIEFGRDSTGHSYFDIYTTLEAHGSYQTFYVDQYNNGHTVDIDVAPYRPLAKPTVSKTTKPGRLKICEPSANDDGGMLSFNWGSDPKDSYTGYTTVNPGSCKTIKVTSHTIYWSAYDYMKGALVATGRVTHIKLPTSSTSAVAPSRSSTTTNRAWHAAWLIGR